MSAYKLEALAAVIETHKYKTLENIVVEGDEGDKFFIVKSGKLDVTINGEFKRSYNQKDFFGERSLLLKEPRSATVTAKSDVECYVLAKNKFLPYLEDNLK